MREILFRGKWKNSGEWVYGNLFNPDKADTPTQICIGTYIARTCYEIDPETVCQFTGLYDKNGRKIFEGDIILYHHKVKKLVPCEDATQEEILHHGLDPESGFGLAYRPKRTIRYKGNVTIDPICGTDLNLNNNCQWWLCEKNGQLTSVEVIGNIYDNPELLKGGNENS